jgi:importin-4
MQTTNEATQEQLLAELSKLTTEQVLELLLMIRTGVNEKIQYATLHLRLYSKTEQSIENFLKIICSEQPLGVRQLASILIDRSLKHSFLDLSAPAQDAVKASLLDRYFKEPERLVRKSLAHNITMIVKYLFDMDKNWDDLLKILANQFTNGNDLVKEVTLSLMSSLFDKCGDMFTEHHSAMMELLSNTIVNGTGKVQTEALRCWAFLLEALDEEEGKLPPSLFASLPQILGVLSKLIVEEREEDLLYDVFDMFVLLIEEDRSMLDPQLPSLIEFIANPKILMNQNLNVNLRSMLIELLCMITETKRTLYSRNPKMLELTVTAMCQTTMDPTKIEDYYSYDEVVMDGLGKMADNLPRKKFYPVLLEVVKKMLGSSDEKQIANAFKVLGAVSEGCADFIAKDLNTIMTSWVVEAMKSGSDRIREAVTRMLSHFVSYVNPDIQLYHKQLVEFFCSSLGLLNPRIAEKALMGLDVFCHQTEKEQIAEHVDLLTRTFMTIIQNPEVTLKMRTISLSALESLIRSAEKLFEPYFNDTHTIVSQFLQISDLKDLSVRAGATAVMASLCKVFCPGNIELFKAGFSNLTKIIYQGLVTHEDHELSEASFEYFSAMAEAVGPLFEEVLDELIVPVFSMAEKIMKLTPTESNPNALAADSDDEDETAPSRKDYFATQPFLSSKASAIYAIGSFAEACPTHFVAKYFARATKIIDDVWNFNYHAVREHAGRSLVCLAKALAIAHNGGKPLPTEENVPRGTPATPYTEEVQNFIESEVMHKLLQSILEDRDILVVTSSFQQMV